MDLFAGIFENCSRILVVEDNASRVCLFKKLLSEYKVDFCDSADQSIELLKQYSYDVIFLDHDLGNREYVDSNDANTGYQVAKFIESNSIESKIFIHSLNPVGVQNIKFVLPNAEVVPYFQIQKCYATSLANPASAV